MQRSEFLIESGLIEEYRSPIQRDRL